MPPSPDLQCADTIAVIIPTFNEESSLSSILEGLLSGGTSNRFDEIVVADGASSDGTGSVAAQHPAVTLVRGPCGRGRQINAGIAASKSRFIVVVHADTHLPQGAAAAVRTTLAHASVAGGCFRLRYDAASRALKTYEFFSRFETSWTTFGDQGFFFRRADYDAIGGLPDWPLFEDVELRRRLKTRGRFVKLAQSVQTSARRLHQRGHVRGQVLNAMLLCGYWSGVSVERLAAIYDADRQSARDR